MNALILKNAQDLGVEINAEAEQSKVSILANATAITAVADDFSQGLAVDALKELKTFLTLVETSRQEIKAPVLTVGKQIDTKAQEFVASLEAEQKRLSGLVTSYTLEQSRKAAQAEAERVAQLKRIEEERIAAEQAAAKEKQRIEESTKDAAPWDMEAAETAKAKLEVAAHADMARLVAQRNSLLTTSVAQPKPEGLSMRRVPKFEVLNIQALYKARPDLVHLEAATSRINQDILSGATEIPGLKVWIEQAALVRGSK